MPLVYVSIGSNLNEPVEQVRRAIETLREFGTVGAVSSLYRSVPWGGDLDQPEFVNAVAALETALAPADLLLALKAAERRLGRERVEQRWGPRVIDLDILTYDDERVDEADLTIPHPHMRERAFVLVPLAEIDERFTAMRDALPQNELRKVYAL